MPTKVDKNNMHASVIDQASGENWTLYNGDCCEVLKGIPDNSIDFCIHSPPFSSLYIYSDSENDMGNCSSDEEFFNHYSFAIKELFRVTVPGRLCAVHCKDLPKYANVWGTTGLIDFPGACIQEFESAGWVFHSRVTIWKCPVTERERTNNNGLLHKTVKRDTSQVRQGMADYLVVFRKPPTDGTLMSAKPIVRPKGFERYIGEAGISNDSHPSKFCRKTESADPAIDIWRRYAEPVWWDINQTDVLNFKLGTSDADDKHICPLQLGLIERAIDIWTAEGDVVLSPFAGVGSEGVGALRCGRKFIGIELKESYFETAKIFISSEARKIASGQQMLWGNDDGE
jgi:DNA modification methylase